MNAGMDGFILNITIKNYKSILNKASIICQQISGLKLKDQASYLGSFKPRQLWTLMCEGELKQIERQNKIMLEEIQTGCKVQKKKQQTTTENEQNTTRHNVRSQGTNPRQQSMRRCDVAHVRTSVQHSE